MSASCRAGSQCTSDRLTIDLSPTKHVVMLLVAALLCIAVIVPAAIAHDRQTTQKGSPKGFAGASKRSCSTSATRSSCRTSGSTANAFVPFALTLFFFILFANLLGLIPYGSTATGNISVTATLAIVTFVVIEVAGMQGAGTALPAAPIVYWPPKDIPLAGQDLHDARS